MVNAGSVLRAAWTLAAFALLAIVTVGFGQSNLSTAHASSKTGAATAPKAKSETAHTARAKIPRLTFRADGYRLGGKHPSLNVFLIVNERFRYKNHRHLDRIVKHYNPRNVRVRFRGHTFKLRPSGAAIPEMIFGFGRATKRRALLRCKVGTHPRATIIYRNREGRFVQNMRIGCRK